MKKAIFLNKNDFLKSFKLVPRVAVNLIIKKESKIFLLKRKIEPYRNYYHFPGSFILKNEKIKNTILRIFKKELLLNKIPSKFKLFAVKENLNGDPRGHIIDIFYLIENENIIKEISENKKGKFFSFKELEKIKLGFKQENYLIDFKKNI